MPRFTPYIRRKKVATLGSSWSAQTITDTIKRVTGRRISAIQIEFVVTNAGTAPTAQSNQSALTFISELRLKASDYAGGSLRAVRRLSGADLVYLNKEDDIQIDRDLQSLMIQTGALSTVYNPSFFLHLSHPNLDETVRHRTALPLNAPDANGTGEGRAYVTEDSVLEIDIPASATLWSANAPSVDVVLVYHEVEMPTNVPYVATEIVSSDFTWSGSGRPTAYEFAQNGWLLGFMMQWKVSAAASDAILATTADYFAIKRGKVEQEAWTIASLRAFNEQGRYVAPSVIAGATTLPNVNTPEGVCSRDFLLNTPTASGWEPNTVPSLYSANSGDRVMLEPTNLNASVTTRFTIHRAYISNLLLLTALN